MDKNKNQQNIYNSSEKEQNIYTPQIGKDLINERDKEIKRRKCHPYFSLFFTFFSYSYYNNYKLLHIS